MPKKKNGSLKYQIMNKLKNLTQFGESKYIAKQEYRERMEKCGQDWNPAKADGIFSYKTFDAYKQTNIEFIKWLKENHSNIKNINNINKDHALQYLQERQLQGKSAYTISKDMSALNKVFNFGITKGDSGLKERSYKNVIRSRNDCKHDSKFNPNNYKDQILFAKATGCRRESVVGGQFQVKTCSAWQDNNGNIFIALIEKGGKFRNAPVLQKYRDSVSSLLPTIPILDKPLTEGAYRTLYKNSKDPTLFHRYTQKIDNHAYRAEYAKERYNELIEARKSDGQTINNDYRGFNKDCVKAVSNSLGHNRLSVVVEHYLK